MIIDLNQGASLVRMLEEYQMAVRNGKINSIAIVASKGNVPVSFGCSGELTGLIAGCEQLKLHMLDQMFTKEKPVSTLTHPKGEAS